MTLDRYLDAAQGRRLCWGEHDCCTFAAGWVLHQTGVDPMFGWRRRYSSEDEAKWLLGALGLPRAFCRGLQCAGLVRVQEFRDGDVGLVSSEAGPAAALRFGAFWVSLDDPGLTYHRDARLTMGVR